MMPGKRQMSEDGGQKSDIKNRKLRPNLTSVLCLLLSEVCILKI